MCGICGSVILSEGNGSEGLLPAMVGKLGHRGPDDSRWSHLGDAHFGATRLEIRCGKGGRQPLVDVDRKLIAVCNGEIDNHKDLRTWLVKRGHSFVDESDVAILPALYRELGTEMFERLEGPFALVLWDAVNRQLILARDRAGERPLFFLQCGGRTVFASELASLVAGLDEPQVLDSESMLSYIARGWFLPPGCPYQGIEKVAPGSFIALGKGKVLKRRYWRWHFAPHGERKSDQNEFDRILRQAVRRQTDNDRDFGIFLSGGLDSSLIAAVARDLFPARTIRSYTLRFDEASFDEGDAAREVADRLSLVQEEVWVRPQQMVRILAELVRTTGEPLADPAWVPVALLARRAAEDVGVVLAGEGGDEVFGGYPTYLGLGFARAYSRLPGALRKLVANIVNRLPVSDRKVTVSYLAKRFIDGWDADPIVRHSNWTSAVPVPVLNRLGIHFPPPLHETMKNAHLLDIIQVLDFESSMAEGLLTKIDRAAMRYSLETRAPFLDRAVLDFASSLSPHERVHGLTTKSFLKDFSLGYLPRSIVHRRKRGLSVPLGAWLRGPLRDWAREGLSGDEMTMIGLDKKKTAGLLDEHLQHRRDHSRPIWLLLTLAEWVRWHMESSDAHRVGGGNRLEAGPVSDRRSGAASGEVASECES